jgi:uncharacterized delta-60 repeat protein
MKNQLLLKLIVVIASLLSLAKFVSGQACPGSPGCLDPTFGNGGFVSTSVNFNTAAAWATDVVIQPDNKIVVAGEVGANFDNAGKDFYVLRYDANGGLDPAFGTGGVARIAVTAAVDGETPYALALQPDGKILVGGGVQSNALAAVVRLNADGSLDPSFGTGGKLTFQFANKESGTINSIKVQANGKIMLGGTSGGKIRICPAERQRHI